MQGITSGLTNLFPQDAADQITDASGRLGYAQGAAQRRKELEKEAAKKAKKRRLMTGLLLAGAAGGHGAAAILKSKVATAVTGGLNTAGLSQATGTSNAATLQEIGRIGATTAAGAASAGAGGGFMSGLSTFGQGALSGLTGGSSTAGTGGAAGALGTAGDILGRMGTSMLMNPATGSGGGGMGGDVGQAAMGALGSYMQEVQSANKTSRVLEGTLKDPAVRSAIYGSGFNDQQSAAVMEYANTLGAVDKAAYLQQALPGIARQAAATTDFARQVQMQNLRNEPDYARIQASQKSPIDISGMASGLKGAITTPTPTTPAPMPGSELDLPGAVGKLESFMIQKYGPNYKARRISPTQKDMDEFGMQ